MFGAPANFPQTLDRGSLIDATRRVYLLTASSCGKIRVHAGYDNPLLKELNMSHRGAVALGIVLGVSATILISSSLMPTASAQQIPVGGRAGKILSFCVQSSSFPAGQPFVSLPLPQCNGFIITDVAMSGPGLAANLYVSFFRNASDAQSQTNLLGKAYFYVPDSYQPTSVHYQSGIVIPASSQFYVRIDNPGGTPVVTISGYYY